MIKHALFKRLVYRSGETGCVGRMMMRWIMELCCTVVGVLVEPIHRGRAKGRHTATAFFCYLVLC